MSSLDLSEFFNNDESDGHRLAEFLQNRRGGVQRPNLLYLNYETQRKSLHVQLEKLPEKNKDKLCDEDKGLNNQSEDQLPTVEEKLASINGESDCGTPLPSTSLPSKPIVSPSNESSIPVLPVKPSTPPVPVRPLSPVRNLNPSIPISPVRPLSPSRPISPRPLSPRLSAFRKSGGIVSPGDRLRRLSLKRLTTKVNAGRRTLLQEFENTVNDADFDPPLCSTPLSQPNICSTAPTTSNSPGDSENLVPNSTDSCCANTESLIKTLQRQDEELKNYMEMTLKNMQQHEKDKEKNATESAVNQSLSQTSRSPLKRTYTLEKGQSPGQVILTPDKSVEHSQSRPSRVLRSYREHRSPETQQPFHKVMKTPDRSLNRSMISINVKSPIIKCVSPQRLSQSLQQREESPNRNLTRSAIMVEKSRSASPLHCSIQNTPPKNVSIIFPSQDVMDVEIPETQEVAMTDDKNCIKIQSNDNTNMPVVIIPITQNFNPSNEEYPVNNTIITAKSKFPENYSKTPLLPNTDEYQSKPEDNLKLTDILTDDDDDQTPKSATPVIDSYRVNNSQAPLNLAPSATNVRTKRLRKRSLSRRRLQMEPYQLLSTETEAEPPAAHINNAAQRKRTIKRKIPLNRAPGTPLNGERYALELNRMSNYEIIDLRKRNSMGRVFAISGRKSSRLQEEANKKQLQLDDEIEMELLRRNLEDSVNNKSTETESPTNDQNNTEGFIPVPPEFRDDSHQQEENKGLESSLVDEKSTDRISFKTKRRSLRNSTKRKAVKPVTKELKQYLEVSKFLKTKQKTRKSNMDQTKRSLYTQGNSDAEETRVDSSIAELANNKATGQSSDKSIAVETVETLREQSFPHVPLPPPSETDQMPSLRVVSPPPPLTITLRKSQSQEEEPAEDDEPLPPPPPEFVTDSDVSSKDRSMQHSSIANIDKDENVFKKPLTPPPPKKKKPGRQKKNQIDNILLNDIHTAQDISADSSLRRSKRQVPANQPIPIFQMLYQQGFNRRLYEREKNLARQKQKLKEMSKATLGDNSTLSSIKSMDSQKSLKKSPTRKKRKNLASIPEDQPLMTCLEKDRDILNNKKTKTLKPAKVVRKKNKKEQHIEEQLECSRINLATPPPVDHFNCVFDHLRDTSTAIEEHDKVESSPQEQQQVNKNSSNCKKLRVRIQRLTPSSAGEESKGNSNSTSSKSTKQLTKLNSTSKTNTVSTSSSSSSASTSTSVTASSVGSNQSNFELISWLKNITESDSIERNDEIFKEMRISSASNLSFSTIQGVEYAFYDTDEKASLGYLRFKPGQIKPKKKAKRYHLHFVTLVGQFRITANDKESRVGPGDMVAIEKSVYYDIENVTDDIGILMVVKK